MFNGLAPGSHQQPTGSGGNHQQPTGSGGNPTMPMTSGGNGQSPTQTMVKNSVIYQTRKLISIKLKIISILKIALF